MKAKKKRSKTSSRTSAEGGPLSPAELSMMHYHIACADHAESMREILERHGSLGDDSVVLSMLSEIAVKHACAAAPLIIRYEKMQEAHA